MAGIFVFRRGQRLLCEVKETKMKTSAVRDILLDGDLSAGNQDKYQLFWKDRLNASGETRVFSLNNLLKD